MQKYLKIFMFLFALAFALPVYSQSKEQGNATVLAVKIKELELKKAMIEEKIALEDKKRNQREYGITPERQEVLNDRQDSLCLELRSERVSIELELKEIRERSNN